MSCGLRASLLGLALLGCGGGGQSTPVVASPVAASPSPASSHQTPLLAASPAPEPPRDSPGFAQALATLRPEPAQGALAALTAAPTEPLVYKQAAIAYADTDVPAMTLIWGMTYLAASEGEADAKLAAALAQVLNERISVTRVEQGDGVDVSVRLAPGQMPTREQPSGAVEAPLAHVFEAHFSAALAGFRPPWTIEQFYDVLSNWAALVSASGTPLDAALELDGWLVLVAKAGHLEAYCYKLLGPAYPAELRAYRRGHEAELRAYKEYAKLARLRPQHAPLPDELVRVR